MHRLLNRVPESLTNIRSIALPQAISFFADTSNNRKIASNQKWDCCMKTANRERQRKWKQKQVSNGMRAVTVMLSVGIKELIDNKRKETGTTIAHIIETAVVNLLASPENASPNLFKSESNQVHRELSTAKIQQIRDDLKTIVHRFEQMAGLKSSVTGNKKSVTNDVCAPSKTDDPATKEIYRLVRLLNNM
jgi:AAA15 family ATPase/GTPase